MRERPVRFGELTLLARVPRLTWWPVLAVSLLGCATTKPPPKVQTVKVGLGVASFRGYGDPQAASICDAEPRFLLDEVASVNGLLQRFLEGTTPDGTWSPEKRTLYEEGQAALPALLEQHAANVRLGRDCAFAKTTALAVAFDRATQLLADVRQRLDDAAKDLEKARAAEALERWNRERLASQEAARRACPAKSSSPVVYFAFQDERGVTQWLFCDGALVRRTGGGEPTVEPAPVELTKGRRPKPATYLTAAKKYPTSAVSRAPSAGAGTQVW